MSTPTVDSFLFIMDIIRENKKFHLVSSGKSFDYQGVTYQPTDLTFREASMKSSGSGASEGFNVSIPANSEAAKYLSLPIASTSTTVIIRLVSVAGEQQMILRGKIQNISDEKRMVALEVGTLRVGLGHIGLNLKYSNVCHHALYGELCGVPRLNYPLAINSEVAATAGGGHVLMSTGSIANPEHYQFGFLTILQGDITLHTPISRVVNAGGNVVIFLPRGLGVPVQGMIARLNKGCDLTFATCDLRFQNTRNFGGFPFFTGTQNPFSNQVLDD